MKLIDLEPQFVRYVTQSSEDQFAEGRSTPAEYLHHVNSVAEAQGIMFLCPSCFAKNAGPIVTHAIEVSFANRGVRDRQGSHNRENKPSRWNVFGSGYVDLTLKPSINCGCWHGYITNGELTI